MGTLVAALPGFVEITVGFGMAVKLQAKLGTTAFPARSCAPLVIVAVYTVPAVRAALGVNVAVVPA
jgi:hypothetical protein